MPVDLWTAGWLAGEMTAIAAGLAVIALVVTLAVVTSARQRERLEGFTADLKARGWDAGDEFHALTKSKGEALAARLKTVPRVSKRPSNVRWWASRVVTVKGRPVEFILLEHSFVVSTGKATAVVRHTVAAAECPRGWPSLSVSETGVLGRLGRLIGIRGLATGDSEFDDRFTVKSGSDDFARKVLHPGLRAVLARLGRDSTFAIAQGVMSIAVRRTAGSAAEAVRLADQIEAALAAIPDEMLDWRGGGSRDGPG